MGQWACSTQGLGLIMIVAAVASSFAAHHIIQTERRQLEKLIFEACEVFRNTVLNWQRARSAGRLRLWIAWSLRTWLSLCNLSV